MNEDKFSCIKQVIKTVQIALPSIFITNEFAGVTEILDSWKRQYVKQVQGIVVNYRNISVVSRTGFIGVNKPFVHYNVKATFDLFCPKVGDIVKGKINRMSREHIGCLVQGTINVTIHLSEETSSELSQFLYLDRDVLFEILHYDFERKMIRVTGSITPRCIQLMKDLFPPENFCSNVTPSNHVVYNCDEGISSNSENSDDDKPNSIMDASTADHSAVGNDTNFKIPPLKKQESDAETVVADFSKPKKTKSPKKRKREAESSTLDTSDLSTADEMPKKKKRRKDKTKLLSENEFEMKNDLLLNGPTETLGYDSFIEKDNKVNHTDILGSIKVEISSPEKKTPGSSHVDKKKKKKKRESSSLSGESESPKKKKKHKGKRLGDSDKKGKDKKSKSKKTKGKLLSSGKVLKKDKKPHKSKDSKKNKKLDNEQSKKHKSSKSHKKRQK